MVGNPLFTWLHLSDIHEGHGSKRYTFDQKQVWRQLEQDVREAIRKHVAPPPNAIFITGDIASTGAAHEYEAIGPKLRALARELFIPDTSIYTVPGNHDVQRSAGQEGLLKPAFAGVRNTGRIDDALESKDLEKLLATRFQNYLDFAKRYAPASDKLYWSQQHKAGRLALRIVGLNTALLSAGDDDRSHLVLGLKQIHETLDGTGNELVILLTHHPLNWMQDGAEVEKRLRGLTHIYLHGHVHNPESNANRAGGGQEWLTICAGAVHADESGDDDKAIGHGYSFGAVGVDEKNELVVEIWPRRYSLKQAGFRIDWENVDPFRPSTRHPLSRPTTSVVAPKRPRPAPRTAESYIFESHELTPVVQAIDTDTHRRLQAVEVFLGSVAERCRALFRIDEEGLDLHPLFVELQSTLDSLVPGIVLNEEHGVLLRAQTRHAILRAETMHSILLAIDKSVLRTTAHGIGKDAANDLIRNVLDSGNYIPASAAAFVALWDFWDRTGGWGKLSLSSRYAEDEQNGRWCLKVSNNFLEIRRERDQLPLDATDEERQKARSADITATHRLNEFWCGYIHGFLEAALPRIREKMLGGERTETVFIPAFTTVEDVKHVLPDSDAKEDVFEIRFKMDPLSRSLSRLSNVRVAKTDYEKADNARMAVHEAGKTFANEVQKEIESLDAGPKRYRLERMRDAAMPVDWEKHGTAAEWIEDANWLIRRLADVSTASPTHRRS